MKTLFHLTRPLFNLFSAYVLALLAPLGAFMMGLLFVGCIGEFGTPPEPVDCKPLASRTCHCDEGGVGVQSCGSVGDRWDSCRCSCTPYEIEECGCAEGLNGQRQCAPSGEYWLACQCFEDGEEINHWVEELQDDRCGVGEVYCPDIGCINLANDSDNCGMCGRVCEGCDRCFRGACTEVCCVSESNCGTEWNPNCSDLDSDSYNCGSCGESCDDDESCVGGRCRS